MDKNDQLDKERGIWIGEWSVMNNWVSNWRNGRWGRYDGDMEDKTRRLEEEEEPETHECDSMGRVGREMDRMIILPIECLR